MAPNRKSIPTSAMYMAVDSPMIDIIVGPEGQQKTFAVHQSLLESRSEYFENALKPERFTEGRERAIRFADEDPEIFHLYLSFAYVPKEVENYTQRIIHGDAPTDRDEFHKWFDPQATKLAAVFALAHMLMDDDMIDGVCLKGLMHLIDANFTSDGRTQAAAFPVKGLNVLYESLPEQVDGEDPRFADPRFAIQNRYLSMGNSDGFYDSCSDHGKLLYDSIGDMPCMFLQKLINGLYEDRIDWVHWNEAQRKLHAKDKEIIQLKARIATLDSANAEPRNHP
ncbi:hypothetical protein N0V86_000075 [Didymella sp. IMI 355093]|nr:hypothetical protein N0V86_000075 [Didymella sp. IMI 355093]